MNSLRSKRLMLLTVGYILLASVIINIKIPTVSATTSYISEFITSASDGYGANAASDYATCRTAVTGSTQTTSWSFPVGQTVASPYEIYRGFLFFDTSSIHDAAIINNATLSIRVYLDQSTTDFNITIQNGQPIYPHDPLQSGDYYYNFYSGDGGSRNTSELTDSNYWNITMSTAGLAWIKVDGTTKLALRSSNDINGITPTGYESVQLYSRNYAEAYAVKLYVGYTIESPYTVKIHGPYYEDGTIYPGIVNVTMFFDYEGAQTYTLNGTDGEEDYVEFYGNHQPTAIYWNISTSYNYSRAYYFREGAEEVWVHVPNFAEYYVYEYEIGIVNLGGVTNAYAETTKNINGSTRVIEKQPLDPYNNLPFWLERNTKYSLRIVSNEGTFVFSLIADSVGTKQFVITADMITQVFTGTNVTVTATRTNETHIEIYYNDPQVETINITTQILHLSGSSYVEDFSQIDVSASTSITWNEGAGDTDYIANVTAFRDGENFVWAFALPKPTSSVPLFWSGYFDLLGEFPIPSYQLPAMFFCLLFFSIGSWKDSDAMAAIAIFLCGIFQIIGWGSFPLPGIATAIMIVVFMYLHRGKQETAVFE